jgi:hypothetical protein
MATFHPFPRLPWEIRNNIWTHAVRPTDPGVHFFSVWTKQDLLKLDGSGEYAHEGEEQEGDSNVLLSAPRCLPPDTDFNLPRGSDQTAEDGEGGHFSLPGQVDVPPPSWFRNNPSTYLVDLALWMACAESRRVMGTIFSTSRRLGDEATYELLMEFLDRSPEGGSGWFAVATHDLFVLQPVNFQNIGDGMGWTDGPYKHVALEYDPQWDAAPHHSNAVTEICCLVAWMTNVNNFWIVDYSLKRRDDAPTERVIQELECAKVFHGRNCRFIEVKEHQGEGNALWEDERNCDSSVWRTAGDRNHSTIVHDFVGFGLEEEVADMSQFFQAQNIPNPMAGRDIRFRVLACEFF